MMRDMCGIHRRWTPDASLVGPGAREGPQGTEYRLQPAETLPVRTPRNPSQRHVVEDPYWLRPGLRIQDGGTSDQPWDQASSTAMALSRARLRSAPGLGPNDVHAFSTWPPQAQGSPPLGCRRNGMIPPRLPGRKPRGMTHSHDASGNAGEPWEESSGAVVSAGTPVKAVSCWR